MKPIALALVSSLAGIASLESALAQGNALRFDGLDDIATVQNLMLDFDLDTAMTLEAWVQVDVARPGGGFVGGQTSGGGGAWILGGGISTPTSAVLSVSTPATDAVFVPGAIVPGPTWTHFAGTWDGALMTLFVNGVQMGQSAHPSPGSTSSVSQLVMGRFATTSSLFFEGALDEVRIWNVVRTPGEIQANYTVQVSAGEPGLVGYYKFDEASGDDILDSSGRGNDGVLGLTPGAASDDPTRIPSGAPVGPGTIGSSYCGPAPVNSTGASAILSATGSAGASVNDLTLGADSLPQNSFGFFITSMTQGFVANPSGSQGNLCLDGSIGRFVGAGQIQNSGPMGRFSLVVDLTQHPTPNGLVPVGAGETWNYQAWYRDAIGGVATSNFTDGLEVVFL